MEKILKDSIDQIDKNVNILKNIFPEAFSDGEIDLNKLLMVLGLNENNDDMYSFVWNGKAKSFKCANSVSNNTLIPLFDESVNFSTTNNIYIEGDNLEVLKTLQKTFSGRIKMIYIDPPYNTGNDFIYNDNFSKNIDDYKEITKQAFRANAETNGRFHTNWLNMIYPRLILAKNLLLPEGVIFISIDDSENANLKKVCDEVFGEYNFIGQFIWQNKKGGGNDSIYLAVEHEYVLAYANDKDSLNAFFESYDADYLKRYKEQDEEGKFFWDTFKRKSGKQYYPITCPDGTILQYDEDGNPISWLRSKERFESDVAKGDIRIININGHWSVQFKQRMPEGKKPRSILNSNKILSDKGTTSTGSDDVYSYFKKDVFSNPKPVGLIEYFLEFGIGKNDYVLDFFSGSATTADAVLRMNAKDGGNRKFILVQLPEVIKDPKETSDANAKRINANAREVLQGLNKPFEITKLAEERIKCCINLLQNNHDKDNLRVSLFNTDFDSTDNIDFGFKVFKLESTNIRPWDSSIKLDENSLLNYNETIKEGRRNIDVAYEIMLKYGVFDMPLKEITISNKQMFDVGEGFMIICLDDNITMENVTEIAKLNPHCVVFKESGFKDDNEKINATYTLERFKVEKVLCI